MSIFDQLFGKQMSPPTQITPTAGSVEVQRDPGEIILLGESKPVEESKLKVQKQDMLGSKPGKQPEQTNWIKDLRIRYIGKDNKSGIEGGPSETRLEDLSKSTLIAGIGEENVPDHLKKFIGKDDTALVEGMLEYNAGLASNDIGGNLFDQYDNDFKSVLTDMRYNKGNLTKYRKFITNAREGNIPKAMEETLDIVGLKDPVYDRRSFAIGLIDRGVENYNIIAKNNPNMEEISISDNDIRPYGDGTQTILIYRTKDGKQAFTKIINAVPHYRVRPSIIKKYNQNLYPKGYGKQAEKR